MRRKGACAWQKQMSSEITSNSLNIVSRAKKIEMDYFFPFLFPSFFFFFFKAMVGISPKDIIWSRHEEQGYSALAF